MRTQADETLLEALRQRVLARADRPGRPDDLEALRAHLAPTDPVHADPEGKFVTDLPEAPTRESVALAFDFARQLRDPAFRDFLRAAGHTSGTTVMTALPTETVAEVLGRLPDDEGRRVLLAVPDDAQPQGWVVAWLDNPPQVEAASLEPADRLRAKVAAIVQREYENSLTTAGTVAFPEHLGSRVAAELMPLIERVRASERERVARYLQRAADAREAAGLSSGAYDAGVLREAAGWCREASIWSDQEQESDPDLRDIEAAVGNARVRFWMCPVREHRDRNDERGWPVVEVEWKDGVARCTAPACTHTSGVSAK